MALSSGGSCNIASGVPTAEPRPIVLRAYAEPEIQSASRTSRGGARPSPFTLVFDCETTPDCDQRLRFGAYQVRGAGVLLEDGFFYDPEAVDDGELAALQKHCRAGPKLRTSAEFVEEVFYKLGYEPDATIVGFNLPFDISGLAMGHESARAVRRRDDSLDRSMQGGFTFKLSPLASRPHVRVRHLNRHAAFINFAAVSDPAAQRASSRGFFVDVKTLAKALTGKSFRLDDLARTLEVLQKDFFKDFARKIDAEFISYAAQDVEVTWLCYDKLINRLSDHGTKSQPSRIYSEAGLGKAYLRAMGVKPWRQVQRGYSAETVGKIMSAYYGGRAEVHLRREIVRVAYCDFASMYPTVCTLMRLWDFVIAEGMTEHDATDEVRTLLAGLTLDQLREPEFWRSLRVLVEVRPDADIFPVRARYGEGPSNTIGVNYLSADRNLWFSLADCIASTLLTGKAPEVVSAIRFEPKDQQKEFNYVGLAGTGRSVHPAKDDFYRHVIDVRREVKAHAASEKAQNGRTTKFSQLDATQLGLKILANATSYDVFIELNVEDAAEDGSDDVRVYGADLPFAATPRSIEREGGYFHPLLAVLITGAARLMLTITERLATDGGLDWAFCDTDSMAFAKPPAMAESDFAVRVRDACTWFEPLNPYKGGGSILEVEGENFVPGDSGERTLEPLYAFAVSAKRYALFNRRDDGGIVIRKASAHGLGHLAAPYKSDDPDVPLPESGVTHWQEDVWRAIIRAALDGHPRHVDYEWDPALREPAAGQHTVSSPPLLSPFRRLNDGLPYSERVKPFNFMLWFHARRPHDILPGPEGYYPRERRAKPMSAYFSDLRSVPPDAIFDRETGEPVGREELRSCEETLRGYHRSPEAKFLNGGGFDVGPLRRRHVFASAVSYIGKEANEFDEAEAFGAEEDDVTTYGAPPADRLTMINTIRQVGIRKLKVRASVGHQVISRAASGDESIPERVIARLYRVALDIIAEHAVLDEEDKERVQWLSHERYRIGLQSLAERLGMDAANLRKVLQAGKIGAALRNRTDRLRNGQS